MSIWKLSVETIKKMVSWIVYDLLQATRESLASEWVVLMFSVLIILFLSWLFVRLFFKFLRWLCVEEKSELVFECDCGQVGKLNKK